MSLHSIEQPRLDQYRLRHNVDDELVQPLGFIALNTVLPGLVEKPRYELRGDTAPLPRASPGSIEHGLGVVGVHQLIRQQPHISQLASRPNQVAVGYAEAQAA